VAQALALPEVQIATLQVVKRSFDARKAELLAVYIVDVALADARQEPALLAQFANHPHIQPAPNMAWHPPVQVPATWPCARWWWASGPAAFLPR